MSKFGLKPWEIGRLSERYIYEVYFYPRDEHGELVVPTKRLTEADFGTRYQPPASLEEELKQVQDLHEALMGTDQKGAGLTNYHEIVGAVKARWADGSRQAAYDAWKAAQNDG